MPRSARTGRAALSQPGGREEKSSDGRFKETHQQPPCLEALLAQHLRWQRRGFWLPARLSRASLPALTSLYAHISATALLPAPRRDGPTSATPRGRGRWRLLLRRTTGLSYSRASAGDKHSTLVNPSCWVFVLQPHPLHLHWVFSSSFPLWHICGAQPLLQPEPGGHTATLVLPGETPVPPALSRPGCGARERLARRSPTQGFNCFLHLRGGNRGKGSGRNPITAAKARGVIKVMGGGVCWQTSVNVFAASPPALRLCSKSLRVLLTGGARGKGWRRAMETPRGKRRNTEDTRLSLTRAHPQLLPPSPHGTVPPGAERA